jgi:hypothetical protein
MSEGLRFEDSWEEKSNPEDPYGRGIEPRGNHGAEDDAERENSYWLSGFVSQEQLERIREYPAHKDSSSEWLIYQTLLGRLVETGPELNPTVRARLRNLVSGMRVVMFPNLQPHEQQSLIEWSQATTFDVSKIEIHIDLDLREDLGWIWNTFGLDTPSNPSSQQLLHRPRNEGN